jgi:hypothetical protein
MTQIIIPPGAGGSVTAAAIESTFTAAGQVYQGTGNGTGALVLPPGFEIGYDQITAPVTVSSTTEGTPTVIIACAAHTFDGGLVILEFFTPEMKCASGVTNPFILANLYEGATDLGRLCDVGQNGSSIPQSTSAPGIGKFRFTPSAGSHTYTIGGWVSGGSGSIAAGAGGAGVECPTYARFTKV